MAPATADFRVYSRISRYLSLLPSSIGFTSGSEEWQTEYRKRLSIARYFSSAKHSRLLDAHHCLNIRKMSLHVAVSLLTYLATVLARLKFGNYAGLRNMPIKLPKEMEPKRQPALELSTPLFRPHQRTEESRIAKARHLVPLLSDTRRGQRLR